MLTTVDPPEVVKFVKQHYPNVIIEKPTTSMWKLIEKKLIPPTRLIRYCCFELKHTNNVGRICVTGVRWAESYRRKKTRAAIEVKVSKSKEIMLLNDNDDGRKLIENCVKRSAVMLNPIIDWSDDDVWEYLNKNNYPHCCLYDMGFKRIGCIGCPMGGTKNMEKEFKLYPNYYKMYLKSFQKVVEKRKQLGKYTWNTADELMHWWIYSQGNIYKLGLQLDGQISLLTLGGVLKNEA